MIDKQRKDTPWYAIQVIAGKERVVCDKVEKTLNKNIYESVFFPLALYRVKKFGIVKSMYKPMFPGYVFVITNHIQEVYDSLYAILELTKVLKNPQTHFPERLLDEEIRVFDDFLDEEYKVSMSEGFIEKDKIFVTKGSLKGYEGCIKKIDRHKKYAWVEIALNGTIKHIKMPLEIVSKR